jgi:hypothetical protein
MYMFLLIANFAKLVGQLDPPKAFLHVLSDANKERPCQELSKLILGGIVPLSQSIGPRGSKIIESAAQEGLVSYLQPSVVRLNP